ncbi:DNA polymerase III subunit delta [Zwartia sp.]|uniref:DNA polymerase III subunit delta n=1 Tax=Zwartia sp. TaxID=2978004 RepID=UPI002718724A|nr:DNA polymerase III subunit delta [Zwartia sp.]MDO9025046.1 DNA polymerase III subunit delta [Zwartia sp.]
MDAQRLINELSRPGASLAALFVVTGDDPLLTIEATDGLRGVAKAAGYLERSSFMMDARSDWSALSSASQSGSLFGDKQLVEISLPTGKPGKQGADALIALSKRCAGRSADDVLTIVSLPRLDKVTRESKWASALQSAGRLIDIPSVERQQLPRWIAERLARQSQETDPETLNWLADKVEGNLLAAHQEILKLGLLFEPGKLDAKDIEQSVMNVARYDVFGLRDAMLAGDVPRMLRIMDGLKAEGEALPLVLWAVGEEIRTLARISQAVAQGQEMSSVLRSHRVFGSREPLVRRALSRVSARSWPAAVQHAHEVDRLIKGLHVSGRLQDPWEEMNRLAMRIAFKPT